MMNDELRRILSFIHHSAFCLPHFSRVRLGGENGEVFFGLVAGAGVAPAGYGL
jgi:hypothetical protein